MDTIDSFVGQWQLGNWYGPVTGGLRIIVIVVVTLVAQRVAVRVIQTFRIRVATRLDSAEQIRRTETLGRVARYVASIVVTAIGVVLVLAEVGISVAPILGAAGVVGLAVGFGAQSLVKDYFTGIFLLAENQLTRGDVVKIADKSGLVEDLTLRYVQLRDYDGNVHFVPNNLITTVTNMSRGFAYAVIDASIAYREDIDAAAAVMQETAARMIADPDYSGRIIAPFEYAGVEALGDSAVVLRGRFKVRALEQWNVKREFLRRLKLAFDAAGIEIPFPHLTVYAGVNKDGNAAPFHFELPRQAGLKPLPE
jgi:moderate conductance mechanosensitive channel